ncbi:hypothetical protein I6N95_07285 [Vagococcus sp. BWB3-3]|uniref:Uncharacterized protein n=1 Tax=Vagococcus allomyrinae TaxID=2794353 RepID=A0A940PB65_9ENTE|nr:hypothetical protein [Vagococcus allomyrinae]MBP1040803.1 hypothetical protein [Vagococcus allomyrinae]
MEIFDLEGKKIYKTASPGTGVVTAELIADTKYQVIIKVEEAEYGHFAFDCH